VSGIFVFALKINKTIFNQTFQIITYKKVFMRKKEFIFAKNKKSRRVKARIITEIIFYPYTLQII
jgi:hypothetical protein